MKWSKEAYNYDFGIIIYDAEVFIGRKEGKMIYTEEEATETNLEIQKRLCIMAKACGVFVL